MLTIAEIVAVHGLWGDVRAALHTDFPERFAELEEVWLVYPDGRRERRKLRDAKPHPTKALMILTLSGCRDRETAAKLIGASVEIEDEQAIPLPDGVYYEHDILGLEVFTTAGESLGEVKEILRTGSNDVYVTPRCLIPALESVVKSIDLAARRITVEPMPGMLDEE